MVGHTHEDVDQVVKYIKFNFSFTVHIASFAINTIMVEIKHQTIDEGYDDDDNNDD